ncbi:MAG: CRISPR-associated helicase Cas3' [Planctomycetia bacterium]
MSIFAHSHSSQLEPGSNWQLLPEHLRNVASLARSNAIGTKDAESSLVHSAWMAGLLHDLGKYRPEFQQMLRGLNVQRERTYHKQAGAAKAYEFQDVCVSFAIAGHHGGLPNRTDVESAILSGNGRDVAAQVWPAACHDLPELTSLQPARPQLMDALTADLQTRFIFSCLVDADWTDTAAHERHASGLPPEPPPAQFEPLKWLEQLLKSLEEKGSLCRESHVRSARRDVLNACLDAANLPIGTFSLSVPTGGGKTLASLAFALKHAAVHGLRRIIYVAPYLTILEQNENSIRMALGLHHETDALFAHHSPSDPGSTEGMKANQTDSATRRAENWDAPLIVTTNVQFFESLFSNKPPRCRKVQNIARSVIILDECQSLPPDLVAPTCGMLGQLATEWNTTIVLCTATQPAFSHEQLPPSEQLKATEIIPKSTDLFRRLKRIRMIWPDTTENAMDWTEIAQKMASTAESFHRSGNASPAALAIVNTRRAARELFTVLRERFDDSVFHLSTSMCPSHRFGILQTVRERLRDKKRCFLIATQLIEAGVDLDFPVVFREMAPLESIIQAAGRCNREGTLRDENGLTHGQVFVFRSLAAKNDPQLYFPPDRWYTAGRSTLENHFLNAGRLPQIDSPADISEYYTRLYYTASLDKCGIQSSRRNFNFADVAEKYQLINQDSSSITVATWEQQREIVEKLINAVRRDPSRANFRRLSPFQLNLRHYEMEKQKHSIAVISENIRQPVWYGPYDNEIGLNPEAADSLLLV